MRFLALPQLGRPTGPLSGTRADYARRGPVGQLGEHEDLAKLGSNLLFVAPGQFGPGHASSDAKPFNARDVEAMRTQLTNVRAVAPVAQRSVTAIFGIESRSTVLMRTDDELIITQDRGYPPVVHSLRARSGPGRQPASSGRPCTTSCSGTRIPSGPAFVSTMSPVR